MTLYIESGPASAEVPINDYDRKWLKEKFSDQMKESYRHFKDAESKRQEMRALWLKGDIEMFDNILKIFDISRVDSCKDCRRRRSVDDGLY